MGAVLDGQDEASNLTVPARPRLDARMLTASSLAGIEGSHHEMCDWPLDDQPAEV